MYNIIHTTQQPHNSCWTSFYVALVTLFVYTHTQRLVMIIIIITLHLLPNMMLAYLSVTINNGHLLLWFCQPSDLAGINKCEFVSNQTVACINYNSCALSLQCDSACLGIKVNTYVTPNAVSLIFYSHSEASSLHNSTCVSL